MVFGDGNISEEMKQKDINDEANGLEGADIKISGENSKRMEKILKHCEQVSPEGSKKIEELLQHWGQDSPEDSKRIEELLQHWEPVSEALNDRFVRLNADFDNYRKRVLKDKEDTSKYANEELIKELLTVLDNLQLAVDYFDPKGNVNSLFEGVKLVQNQLMTTLKKFGLTTVDIQEGSKFDPMFHQAVEKKSGKAEPELILEERAKGYILNGRLVRPSMVVVSTSDEADKVTSEAEDVIKKGQKDNSEEM